MFSCLSAAVHPVCRSYLFSHAYFVILRMHMREICLPMREILHMKPLHWVMSITGQKTQAKTPKLHFSTDDLDLRPMTSNSSERSSRSIPIPNFVTVCQSVQPWECSQTDTDRQTDWQADGSIFITASPDAAGKNRYIRLYYIYHHFLWWSIWHPMQNRCPYIVINVFRRYSSTFQNIIIISMVYQ